MIEMEIRGLLVDPFGGITLFLGEKEKEKIYKVIPMGIDIITARAIDDALHNQETPRPLIHELMEKSLRTLGAQVDRIEITEIRDGAFIGNLVIVSNIGLELHFDSRPSDGIAMALRFGARILVTKEVLDNSLESITEEFANLLFKSM